MHASYIPLPLLAALTALVSAADAGTVNRHVETFGTTLYRDTAHTTADWNTAYGQLRLPLFQPTVVGKYCAYSIGSRAYSAAVAGDYAYLCYGPVGLKVLDISDPRAPVFAGTFPSINSTYAIDLEGDLAYIAGGAGGLQVPLDPAGVATLSLGAPALDVAVAGHIAYVTAGGLRAIDIATPSAPGELGGYTTPGRSGGLALGGHFAYVAHNEGGLLVFLISPTMGVQGLVAVLPLPGQAWDVALAGNVAYVACAGAGLQVVDITTPVLPALIGSYAPSGTIANGIAVDGDFAYLADGVINGLQVLSVATPSSPTLLWSLSMKNPQSAIPAGAHLFVADEDSGLAAVEVRQPTAPVFRGWYNTPGNAQDVCIDGDYAFVADQASGLRIVDIRNTAAPVSAGVCPLSGTAYEIVVMGDYAYVAAYTGGLQVVDVQSPSAPFVRGATASPDGAQGIAVAGRYAYLACTTAGLQVVDIANPASPAQAGLLDTGFYAYGVAVEGSRAFVAGTSPALAIVDVGDPANPTLVGSYPFGTSSYGVAVDGDIAYLAAGTQGLRCIDVSNPAAPALLGSHATPGTAMDVAVSGNYVFVADLNNGMHAFDVSDPAAPVLIGSYALPPYTYGLALDGDHVFVAGGSASGLQVLRVFQRQLAVDRNVGQSLDLAARAESIGKARLTSVQLDSIGWQLSADGGTTWAAAVPDGPWVTLAQPGNDLRWRSAQFTGPQLVNPYCDEVTVEWLYDFPVIQAVTDVPDDQGGWVRVHVLRSGRDFADEIFSPITAYYLWHRVDDTALSKTVATAAPVDVSNLPPGTWEVVGSFPAMQQDSYIHLTPTTADSTASTAVQQVFLVTAHTASPTLYFTSPPDSGCSVDNIAPGVPEGFAVAYGSAGNALTWSWAAEPDFQYFRVYRGDTPDFVPQPGSLVHSTAATSWVDAVAEPWLHHYKVAAVDHAGNESAAASPVTVSGAAERTAPGRFALHAAAPNPFNPLTTIRFDIPTRGRVHLEIYDARGKLVRRLIDADLPAGRHEAPWDGRSGDGVVQPSGVYFGRLSAGNDVQTVKLVLVR
jgi:hypothetical protein